MNTITTKPVALKGLRSPHLTERFEAARDYYAASMERSTVTRDELAMDETLLDDIALAVAGLAKKVERARQFGGCIYSDADPSQVFEQLLDVLDDALSPEAARLVRAQARIDGGGA